MRMDLRFVKGSENFVEGRLYSVRYRVSKRLLLHIVFDLRYEQLGVSVELYEIVNLKNDRLWLITSESLLLDTDKRDLKKKVDEFLSSDTFSSIVKKLLDYAYNTFDGFVTWRYNRKKRVWEKVYSVDGTVKKVVEVPKP